MMKFNFAEKPNPFEGMPNFPKPIEAAEVRGMQIELRKEDSRSQHYIDNYYVTFPQLYGTTPAERRKNVIDSMIYLGDDEGRAQQFFERVKGMAAEKNEKGTFKIRSGDAQKLFVTAIEDARRNGEINYRKNKE